MAIEVYLITGRSVKQGESMEKGKIFSNYTESAAICELDSSDMEKLKIKDGDTVKVKTEYGEVVVKAVASKKRHPSVAFIPMGPWANAVVDPATDYTGMPSFKGVKAKIESTGEKVLNGVELIKSFR
ncbi:MAG: molybdopterin dinucleotide binding domain-containing protein [Candidatus Hydrothermarchaeota archaeon]